MTLLTLGEASRHTGLDVRTLKRALEDKRLPARRRDGWVYQIESDDLASFSLAYQVEQLSAAAGERQFLPERPRAAVPPRVTPTGLRHWFRMLVAALRPAQGLPARRGGAKT